MDRFVQAPKILVLMMKSLHASLECTIPSYDDVSRPRRHHYSKSITPLGKGRTANNLETCLLAPSKVTALSLEQPHLSIST